MKLRKQKCPNEGRLILKKMCVCISSSHSNVSNDLLRLFFCYNLSTQNSDENLKHFRYEWKSKKKTTRQIFYFGTLEILSKFFLQSHSGRTILSHSKISVSILSRDPLVVVRSKFFLFNTFRRVIYWIFVPSSAMYVLCTCISIKVTVLHWIYIEIGKMADS